MGKRLLRPTSTWLRLVRTWTVPLGKAFSHLNLNDATSGEKRAIV